ncbi:MAG: NAD-dependent epimerase/dehydratase family protein [Methanosarcinales archaeon]|nr:MAG: NAD-dependent epimerase/dehydratase family protein [Methanosarcinales archaeon]
MTMRRPRKSLKRINITFSGIMNNKTVLITGSNGFIGNRLTAILSDTFPKITIKGVGRVACSNGPETFVVNLLEPEPTFRIIEKIKPDYIFHLAGVIYTRDWQELYRGNVKTTFNIMEGVKKAGIPCRIVIPGSAAEYGRVPVADLPINENQIPNPIVPYGVAKVWQTTIARYYASLEVEVVIGRLFNIIGPGAPEGLSVGAFASQLGKIKRGELPPKILVGNLEPKRDFIDIVDVCRGLVAVAEKGRSGEVYNICSGNSIAMREILHMMIGCSGLKVDVSIDSSRLKANDIDDIFGDNTKITMETGWYPTVSIGTSIKEMLQY